MPKTIAFPRVPLVNVPKPPKEPKRLARVGKVGKRKLEAGEQAKAHYFQHHAKRDGTAPCQFCRCDMTRKEAKAHHKTPRGEGSGDKLTDFVAVHDDCHIKKIHGNHFGRPPVGDPARETFELVESSEANVSNGFMVTGGLPR